MKSWWLISSVAFSAPVLAADIVGQVVGETPLSHAIIKVIDSQGQQRTTESDGQGYYRLASDGLTPPLRFSAIEPLNQQGEKDNCLYSDRLRARCLAAWQPTLSSAEKQTVNINPLTDKLVSDLAKSAGMIGPQQWIEAKTLPAYSQDAVPQALSRMQQGLKVALKQAGYSAESQQFNPVTVSDPSQRQAMNDILAVLQQNRGYDNDSGQSSATTITDVQFTPILGVEWQQEWQPFDYFNAKAALQAIQQAKHRILIVGDSTAASYEAVRLPRAGWGQVLPEYLADNSQTVILNGARAGRSSRDFYHERWYQQMARWIKAGDMVLIAMGHNDENCKSTKPKRGQADVANLCTYPDDNQGREQYRVGHPDTSFRRSLQRYIDLAHQAGAVPVLITPTARVRDANKKVTYFADNQQPVASTHYTRAGNGYAFGGDYIQTIRNAGKEAQVPVLEIEQQTIDFANQHAKDWRDYWLAIKNDDPRYPYYHNDKQGTWQNPDATHFQLRGARVVAGMVVNDLLAQPQLKQQAPWLSQSFHIKR